jgi:hypothetical protein
MPVATMRFMLDTLLFVKAAEATPSRKKAGR